MKYIYLDWNVFQHMKHRRIDERKNIDGIEFKRLIKNLSSKYVFPYSEGHLRDLSISGEEYIKEDLEFIKNISRNYVLGFSENEEILIQKDYIEIEYFFDEIKEITKNELNLEITIDFAENNHYNIEIKQMDNDDLLKPFLEQNKGVLDNETLANFIMKMYEYIDNPDFYKNFREQIYKLKKKFKNTQNSLIDQQSNYFKEIEPFLNFIVENDIGNMKKNFKDAMVAFLNIDKKRKYNELTIGRKIELAYSLLDYNQHFRDKINKKNRPSNMFRDIKHLHFASDAKYYVTEDDKTYEKSKFVCEVLELNVKMLKMSEFINRFR